jgi:ABC-type lipoprotein release transport system permease subunit
MVNYVKPAPPGVAVLIGFARVMYGFQRHLHQAAVELSVLLKIKNVLQVHPAAVLKIGHARAKNG